jgi:hypothetical protein
MSRRRREEQEVTSELVCLRCGTPYDEDATVCFTCGAPIGEIKSPTQPVAVPRLPKREPPPEAVVDRAAVLSAPTAPSVPPPPLARKPRWWPIILLAVIVALAVGSGVAYVVRGLTASPPVASSQVYRDPQQRYHFTRPTLWTLTPHADGVLLTDSDGINSMTLTLSAAQPDQTAKAAADALAKAQKLTAGPQQQFAGTLWEVRSGVHTDADGATRQTVVYLTFHGGTVYTITCVSPLASYNSTNNLVYQPLLASFAFDG